MYNRQLDTFLTVVDTGNFSRAAEALFISPSAVIQQMNNLESTLEATLFVRSRQGLTLTPAGEYLANEAKDYIKRGKAIQSKLVQLDKASQIICLGTSEFEKIHLFSDYWLEFAGKNTDMDIKIINMDDKNSIDPKVELIESMYDGMPWHKDWEFLKLCDMPLYIGVERHQELSKKSLITAADLTDRRVLCLRRRGADTKPLLSRELMEKGITVEFIPNYDRKVRWRCARDGSVIILPPTWGDLVPDIIPIPYEKSFTMPCGFFYRKDCSALTKEFVEFVRNTPYPLTSLSLSKNS